MEDELIEERKPRFRKYAPVIACPNCDEGVIHYNYVHDQNEQLLEYLECSELMCGTMFQGTELEMIINYKQKLFTNDNYGLVIK